MDLEKNGYIKLPYGFVSNENDKGKLRFNLPLNYKKDLLFRKVPYFAEVNNLAIDDVVLGKKRDDLSIQKFLLGKGVLEDAVLDNLDMIVTDRRFNNVGIRRKLDKKYPSIMKKPTASNFLFRDKKQFDLQNPVIGGLYNQLKIRTADQLKLLKTAPKIKDLKIQNALDRLKKFNLNRGAIDDDDDDNDIPGLPPSRRGEPPGPPGPNYDQDDQDDDDDDNNDDDGDNNIQRFLLNQGNERIAEPLAESDAGVEPRKIAFSKEITKVFPRIKQEELDFGEADKDEFKDEFKDDYDFLDKYDKKTTDADFDMDMDLDFFVGGDKNRKKLVDNAVSYVGKLNNSNKMFIEYLSSNYGAHVLSKNKLKIHLESGQFFHDNNITNESIYDFFLKQQDETKKELLIEVPIGNDFKVYVRELLTNVKDDDYDIHTNSTAKFLFYNFNTFRLANRLNPLIIRHSQTVTNEKAISILQSHNWQYFVDQLLHIANGDIKLDDFDLEIDQEFDKYTIIEKTSDNVNYCRQFYEEVFNDIAYFFQRMIKETPNEFLEPLRADLANELYFTNNLKEIESHVELLKTFNKFYFKTGRFPGNYTDLILVPAGRKPDFVKTFDQISPSELNEKFQNGPSYGIAAVQFLAGLNIHFGGDKKLSQDVMSEFLHNLSWQALTIDNSNVNIKFDAIIELNKNIKRLIRDVDRSNIKIIEFENGIDENEDKVRVMEEEVVNNIITNRKIEFPRDFKPPMPNTLTQVENDIKKIKAIKRKTNESLNDVYGEITRNLITETRNDLIKSVTDYEGDTPMQVIDNITSSYQKPKEDPVKKSVRRHIKDSIKNMNQQYFKQRRPTLNYKEVQRNIKPQLKITDIVNRNISAENRSSSLTSLPISDVEMLSRSASLDSISTMKREYSDQEMISRPPSVSSIRDSVNTNIEMSFKQPIVKKKPIKFVNKKTFVKPPVGVKPREALIGPVKDTVVKSTDTPLSAAVKSYIKSIQTLTPAAKVVLDKKLKQGNKPKLPPKPIRNPPTVSLIKSIDHAKKPISKKQATALKADVKKKQEEQVVRWRKDVEMVAPIVIGKRKKDSQLASEAKTKKEN